MTDRKASDDSTEDRRRADPLRATARPAARRSSSIVASVAEIVAAYPEATEALLSDAVKRRPDEALRIVVACIKANPAGAAEVLRIVRESPVLKAKITMDNLMGVLLPDLIDLERAEMRKAGAAAQAAPERRPPAPEPGPPADEARDSVGDPEIYDENGDFTEPVVAALRRAREAALMNQQLQDTVAQQEADEAGLGPTFTPPLLNATPGQAAWEVLATAGDDDDEAASEPAHADEIAAEAVAGETEEVASVEDAAIWSDPSEEEDGVAAPPSPPRATDEVDETEIRDYAPPDIVRGLSDAEAFLREASRGAAPDAERADEAGAESGDESGAEPEDEPESQVLRLYPDLDTDFDEDDEDDEEEAVAEPAPAPLPEVIALGADPQAEAGALESPEEESDDVTFADYLSGGVAEDAPLLFGLAGEPLPGPSERRPPAAGEGAEAAEQAVARGPVPVPPREVTVIAQGEPLRQLEAEQMHQAVIRLEGFPAGASLWGLVTDDGSFDVVLRRLDGEDRVVARINDIVRHPEALGEIEIDDRKLNLQDMIIGVDLFRPGGPDSPVEAPDEHEHEYEAGDEVVADIRAYGRAASDYQGRGDLDA